MNSVRVRAAENKLIVKPSIRTEYRSQWPRGRRRGSAADRSLGLRVRIPPRTCMSACCECFVLSGIDLCDELIPRPGEPYQL